MADVHSAGWTFRLQGFVFSVFVWLEAAWIEASRWVGMGGYIFINFNAFNIGYTVLTLHAAIVTHINDNIKLPSTFLV